MPEERTARRVTKACDFCHTRSIRCRLSEDEHLGRCKNCVDANQPCTSLRPSKKRGFPSGSRKSNALVTSVPLGRSTSASSNATRHVHTDVTNTSKSATDSGHVEDEDERWVAPQLASQTVIMDLVEIYFEVVYPIFPLFHRPSFIRSVARAEYLTSQSSFSAVMSLCALVSARVRDGSQFFDRWDTGAIRQTSPDQFINAASRSIPKEFSASRNLRYLQSTALLSLASLQVGILHDMHSYLGIYQMLCKVEGLHKESNWPSGAGPIEIEERRRLFWSMYTLDIFSATVFGTIPNCREALSRVQYPTEDEDENIIDQSRPVIIISNTPAITGTMLQSSPTGDLQESHWLRGWNFTTDIYRILEHILDTPVPRDSPTAIFDNRPKAEAVLDKILSSYATLPQIFRETPLPTETVSKLGMQAVNIAATIQLARMTLLSTSSEESTTAQKCQFANDLLQSFCRVPDAYLKAISTPLLYHLAGIGTMLWPAVEKPLTGSAYEQIRSVLLALADLLTTLEHGMVSGTGASARLRAHIQRMDDHVQQQRHEFQHHSDRAGLPTSYISPMSNVVGSTPPDSASDLRPEFIFPTDMLDEWSWAFDFTQILDDQGFRGNGFT